MAYESRRFRERNQPDPARNLLHKELSVMHACPECDIGKPRPFCTVCAGRGLLTDLQLGKWERDHQVGY